MNVNTMAVLQFNGSPIVIVGNSNGLVSVIQPNQPTQAFGAFSWSPPKNPQQQTYQEPPPHEKDIALIFPHHECQNQFFVLSKSGVLRLYEFQQKPAGSIL